MSVLDKFLNVMRLNPDDEDDFYNEDYYDENLGILLEAQDYFL